MKGKVVKGVSSEQISLHHQIMSIIPAPYPVLSELITVLSSADSPRNGKHQMLTKLTQMDVFKRLRRFMSHKIHVDLEKNLKKS